MVQSLKFSVIGENDDVFEVTISRDANNSSNLKASCTCGQARRGEFCGHRFDILEGERANLASDNVDDLDVLAAWIRGSDIESAMKELSKARSDLNVARDNLAYKRRMLVKRMLD
ncbi:MAG: hypothetical protein GC152_14605 [Alphaproteobacteria bacterium]|nr:hypothetical protein [Alphaproteobacteria bacterium]